MEDKRGRGRPAGSQNKGEKKEYLNLALSPGTIQKLQEEADKLYIPLKVFAASILTKIVMEDSSATEKDS